MNLPAFSLRALLVGVALFAAVLVAFLVPPTAVLPDAILAITSICLLAVPLKILYSHGECRAFWTGAAAMGWGYLILCHSSFLNLQDTMYEVMEFLCQLLRRPSAPTSVWHLVPLGHSCTAILLSAVGGKLGNHVFRAGSTRGVD